MTLAVSGFNLGGIRLNTSSLGQRWQDCWSRSLLTLRGMLAFDLIDGLVLGSAWMKASQRVLVQDRLVVVGLVNPHGPFLSCQPKHFFGSSTIVMLPC